MVKFGYCIHYRLGDILNPISKAKELGFDFVDFTIDHPSMIAYTPGKVKTKLKSNSLAAGIQTPWESIFFDSSWDDCVNGSIKTIKKCGAFAKKINAEYMNLHIRNDMGSFVETFDLYDEKVKRMINSLRIINNTFSNKLLITGETGEGDLYSDLDTFHKIVKESGIKVCIDTAHTLKKCRNNFKEFNKWINVLKDDIYIAHLSGVKYFKDTKRYIPHYHPTKRQLELIVESFKKCKNLKYIMFEFFRGIDDNKLDMYQIKMLETIKAML